MTSLNRAPAGAAAYDNAVGGPTAAIDDAGGGGSAATDNAGGWDTAASDNAGGGATAATNNAGGGGMWSVPGGVCIDWAEGNCTIGKDGCKDADGPRWIGNIISG